MDPYIKKRTYTSGGSFCKFCSILVYDHIDVDSVIEHFRLCNKRGPLIAGTWGECLVV